MNTQQPKPSPSFETFADASRFFVDVKNENGEDGKMMINLRKSCVVVTTASGDKVAFMKTNRGKTYRDSRGKKVTKKSDWGDKETIIRPLMISAEEVQSELKRLLDDSWMAEQAFRALQV
jgi:hypothetical protein